MKTFNLTHPQKRIWYIEQLYPHTNTSNIVLTFRFNQPVNPEILWQAIEQVINVNDSLKLRFIKEETEIKQYLSDYEPQSLQHVRFDYSGGLVDEQQWIQKQTEAVLPLFDCDLFIFCVVTYHDGIGGFLMTHHHAISDAWTVKLISDQIKDLYFKLLLGGDPVDVSSQPSYLEVIEQELFYKSSDMFKRDKKFWMDQFRSSPLPLKSISRCENLHSINSQRFTFVLTEEETQRINKFTEEYGMSAYILLFSTFNIYLYRSHAQNDFVVGTVTHNRGNHREKNTAGMFINTIPFRVKIDPDQSALTFMRQTVKVLKKIYRHQKYPYDLLVQDLQNESVELSELLEYVFSYENISYQLKNEWHFSGHEFFPFVIHVTEREGASRLKFEIDFREESYSQNEIKRWMKSYTQLLTSVLSDPSQALKNINLLTTDDIDFFINTLNNTSTDYPKQEPIQLIFEQQVMNYADRTALVFQDTLFSYRDLNRKANQLARVIQSCGFKDGLCVGLIADRTPDMIISILAILKAGGTYVPINPDYPENRMEYMFKDSDIRIVVIDKKYFEKISFYKGEIIYLDDNDLYTGDDRNLDIKMSFDDVAVIVYTSGSTGNPKGNLVTHRNIIRVVKKTNYVDICENDILLQLSNYAFDGSFFDIFGSLLNGAQLVLIDAVSMLNIKKLAAFIEDHNISMFFITTAMFNTIVDVNVQCLRNLNKLFFGGERVSFSHVRKALNSLGEDKLVHVYGPTESTVFATYYPINALDENLGTVPIGKPIANTEVYVLDLYLNPLPPGVIGELYIGGDGLVKGYLNLPELSGDKFLESPFTPGARLYRTGDYVRLLEDGNIEFIGRTDHQIKRRGFRVELGEVESVIAGHPFINKTIVVYNDDDENNMYLCAYYVADEVITSSTMKSYLLELMPSYAIPDYFIQLDQLPINANGKIDLRSLPLPETDSGDTICNDEFSFTDTQKTLVNIWKDVLSRSYVGLHDGFFELGGNSLKLIVMQSDIDEKFPGIVEVGDLFAYPTIERLSHFIESQEVAATTENEIKTINIPSDFFVSGSEINPNDIISWQLDPDIYPVLNKLFDQWNIDLIDVFLSKYVYLFSLISEDQEITVYVQANEGMATFPVTISVAEIDEWSDLFMTVKAVRSRMSQGTAVNDLWQHSCIKDNSSIVVMFACLDKKVSLENYPACDLIFCVDIKVNQIDFECTYNSERIKKQKIDELVGMYKRLTLSLLDTVEESIESGI